ncbi:hypothetical protein [Aeromonas caviae]|uniref:hypothetical protein n=1 Tax=Aeromonas caviae TaxID=648 RepID=UPI001CC66352|nr:hypothetical protein [Aeromonas caviae]BDN94469.1 hypothetical protein KAM497c_40130 [Aeromonas caviae]GJB02163.1 hypothetical protein KAM360_11060 [Aeromonas caviae]GKR68739.1 hypothetical protein KAM479_06600 [Aeromonas caviae]
MNKRNYDVAKKEVVFIALPLLLLFIIKLFDNALMSFVKISDFSLALSMMYGQLLAKSLDVPDTKKRIERFSTYQVYIFAISMISITMYISFNLIPSVRVEFYIAQIIIFIVGIIFYIPMSTLMSDLSKK